LRMTVGDAFSVLSFHNRKEIHIRHFLVFQRFIYYRIYL
jgi:hypothetical protein